MRAVVAVTDSAWVEFLRARPHVTEANFWRPGLPHRVRAVTPGELWLFKTGDHIVGGGTYVGDPQLPVSQAWKDFGEGNGRASHSELLAAIRAKRRTEPDPTITCVLLKDLFFTPPGVVVPKPPDWLPGIQSLKSYDFAALNASPLEDALAAMIDREGYPIVIPGPLNGPPSLRATRPGQSQFRSVVLDHYGNRCAITGNRVIPVLDAAHIRPVEEQGENRVDNGLALRTDVHRLFDAGLLGIDQEYRLHVSERIRDVYGNGEEFYSQRGRVLLVLPRDAANRPHRDFIEYHMDTVFQSA